MAFHDVRMPTGLSFGCTGGPGFNTFIKENPAGLEQRLTRWSSPKKTYFCSYIGDATDDIYAFLEFYYAREGAKHSFRFKDPRDFTSNTTDGRSAPAFDDIQIGTGDDTTKVFQLSKRYTSSPTVKTINITKPVTGTVLIGLNGVSQASGWTVDTDTGLVTFLVAPTSGHAVTAGYEFDIHMNFSSSIDQSLSITMLDNKNFEARGIEVVEVKDSAIVNEELNFRGAVYVDVTEDYFPTIFGGSFYNIDTDGVSRKVVLPSEETTPLGADLYLKSNTPNFNLTDSAEVSIISPTVDGTVYLARLGLDSVGDRKWFVSVT